MAERSPLLLALGIATACLLAACARDDGPEPIAYDREPCAYCRMLISDPGFAAQLQLVDQATVSFDDPGCLMLYRDERTPSVRAAWFRHAHEDRWIPESEVGFVPVPHSPMDYDLGAVDASTDGAISLDEAVRRVRNHSQGRRHEHDARR